MTRRTRYGRNRYVLGFKLRIGYGEVYAYRVRRPSGRPWPTRWGYVGQTGSPDLRDAQHKESQNWSDLIVSRRVVFSMQWCPQFVLNTAEWLAIKLLRPVYNVQHNRHNVRAIPPWAAKSQRRSRDMNMRPQVYVKAWRTIIYTLLAFGFLAGMIERIAS